MVRNQTITSAVSAELTGSLQQTLAEGRLRRLEQHIGLPTTFAGFVLMTLAVALLCAGMALLVITSVQTYQARQQIVALERTYRMVERENAEFVWQIAQHTTLEQVRQRALALGYQPPAARHFVPWSSPSSIAQAPAERFAAPTRSDDSAPTSPDLWGWAVEQVNRIRTWW
jgi:cell division protein FtsL